MKGQSPSKRSKKHRKKHILPGPAGQWFQNCQQSRKSSGNIVRNGNDEIDCIVKPGHVIESTMDTDADKQQRQHQRQSAYSQTWDAMCLSLDRVVPCHASLLSIASSSKPPPSMSAIICQMLRQLIPPTYTLLQEVIGPNLSIDRNTTNTTPDGPPNDPLEIPLIVFQIEAVHCHGHCDWTVHLTDESTSAMTASSHPSSSSPSQSTARPTTRTTVVGWLSEDLVRRHPEWIRPGVVVLCSNVRLAVFESAVGVGGDAAARGGGSEASTLLVLGGENIVYAWTPEEAVEEVTDERFLDLLERRAEVEQRLMVSATSFEGEGGEEDDDDVDVGVMSLKLVGMEEEGRVEDKSSDKERGNKKRDRFGRRCHDEMVNSKAHDGRETAVDRGLKTCNGKSNITHDTAVPVDIVTNDASSKEKEKKSGSPKKVASAAEMSTNNVKSTNTAKSTDLGISSRYTTAQPISQKSTRREAISIAKSPFFSNEVEARERLSQHDTIRNYPSQQNTLNKYRDKITGTQCASDLTNNKSRLVTPSSHIAKTCSVTFKSNDGYVDHASKAKDDGRGKRGSLSSSTSGVLIRNPYIKKKKNQRRQEEDGVPNFDPQTYVPKLTDSTNSNVMKIHQVGSRKGNYVKCHSQESSNSSQSHYRPQLHMTQKEMNATEGKTKEVIPYDNKSDNCRQSSQKWQTLPITKTNYNQDTASVYKNRLSKGIREHYESPQIERGGGFETNTETEGKEIIPVACTDKDSYAGPNPNDSRRGECHVSNSIWTSYDPQDSGNMDLFDEQNLEPHAQLNRSPHVDIIGKNEVKKKAEVLRDNENRNIRQSSISGETRNNVNDQTVDCKSNRTTLFSNMDTLDDLDMDGFLEEDDNI